MGLTEPTIPTGQLALSGPSEKLDAAHWPVRGDLAHIRLAGRCFVPHYAVPMPHRLKVAAPLRRTAQAEGEVLAELPAGAAFDVLDMAGGWHWGQVGDDGFVGYIPADLLEPAA
ncbi:MAG: SH3 domain-containing protein [Sphingomonadales bacterium]|nr:SH3 domain-containing protein [Sphingomonadales bacterium]